MRKSLYTLIFVLGLFSCNGQKQVSDTSYGIMLKGLLEHNVKEMSIPEAVKAHQQKAYFLDARELNEYTTSHIQNAIWIGYNTFDQNKLKNIPKQSKIIIYCSVGYRSEKISQKLQKLGYTSVYNMYGGIFEWVNQGNIVYNTNSTTKKVHAYDKQWGIWLKKGEKVY